MKGLFSKLSAYIIYHSFIYFSRHVSFTDFQKIWNEAYQAHVEAEWKRMKLGIGGTGALQPMETKGILEGASLLNSTNIKSTQEGQVGEAALTQNEQPSKLTSEKPGPEGGQGEKQPPSPPSQPPSQSKLKYKRKGA